MLAKMLLAWGILMLCLTIQAESQYDPLGIDVLNAPTDLRRTSSLNDEDTKMHLDPRADPLGIDPLMRPLDPEHTWEYLAKVSNRANADNYTPPESDLGGNWRLELKDSAMKIANLVLVQNGEVIFGRGMVSIDGRAQAAYTSGQTSRDILYLDVICEDLTFYRCALTISKDLLSGSYYAYDAPGRVWTGTAGGSRTA